MTTPVRTMPSTLLARVTGSSVGARPLAIARVLLALASLLKLFLVLPPLSELDSEQLPLPILPLPDLPSDLIVTVWALAAVLLLTGRGVPLTAGLLALCGWYTLLLDERTYSNHLLLMALLATYLAFSGGGQLRGAGKRVSGTAVFLALTQVSTMYAFSALAKVNPSFLAGDVLRNDVGSDSALVSFSLSALPQALVTAGAVLVIAVELGLAIALWVPLLRPYAIISGILIHLSFILTMPPLLDLVVFGLLSVATYPLFASWRPLASRRGCR